MHLMMKSSRTRRRRATPSRSELVEVACPFALGVSKCLSFAV